MEPRTQGEFSRSGLPGMGRFLSIRVFDRGWPSASKDYAKLRMHCIECQGEHCLCGEILEVSLNIKCSLPVAWLRDQIIITIVIRRTACLQGILIAIALIP